MKFEIIFFFSEVFIFFFSFLGSQLAHFMARGMIQAVFGPPGLLLHGVKEVIISWDLQMGKFEWVKLSSILTEWKLSSEQFFLSCLLAGTEYCLTYPYLNLDAKSREEIKNAISNGLSIPQPPPTSHSAKNFSFDNAVDCMRTAPFQYWMGRFFTWDMLHEYLLGYSIAKTLMCSSPVLNTAEWTVNANCLSLGASVDNAMFGEMQSPCDLETVIGQKLPDHMYLLICLGAVSHELPAAITMREWRLDELTPMVDSMEHRNMVKELQPMRNRALGIICQHLGPLFHDLTISHKSYVDTIENEAIRETLPEGQVPPPVPRTLFKPDIPEKYLHWNYTRSDLEAEMRRQKVTEVTLDFCLRWHAHQLKIGGPLVQDFSYKKHACDPETTSQVEEKIRNFQFQFKI